MKVIFRYRGFKVVVSRYCFIPKNYYKDGEIVIYENKRPHYFAFSYNRSCGLESVGPESSINLSTYIKLVKRSIDDKLRRKVKFR